MKWPPGKLEEMALLYEELTSAPDPTEPKVRQAEIVFESECQRLYDAESVSFRKQMPFRQYNAMVIVVDVLNHLKSRR